MLRIRFPHPIVYQQISAQQPRLAVVLVAYSIPVWSPVLIEHFLISQKALRHLAEKFPSWHMGLLAVFQILLICIATSGLSFRYASALWGVKNHCPYRPPCSILFALIGLPLGWCGFWAIKWTAQLVPSAGSVDLFHRELIHSTFWGQQEYGASITGVICSSMVKLIGPMLEEVTFSGVLANILVKKAGARATIVIVPIAFALVHISKIGFGLQLLPICVSGLLFLSIRFISGRLWYALITHVCMNAIGLLPWWIEAYLYFSSQV